MRISTKINLTSVGLLVLATAGFLTTLLLQRGALRTDVLEVVRDQGLDEASKIAQGVYQMCLGTENRNQSRLDHSLNIAREVLAQAGGIRTGTNDVVWNAVNQFTREGRNLTLPGFHVGEVWLGQNFSTNQVSPVVDEASHLTRDFCTIFQRMNSEGDMLRVSTTVIGNDGQRAIGTYIPHRLSDGTMNPVIDKVLRGESYRGRAFVVNQYHASAYEPIWDSGRREVIGMLYVGIGLSTINKELHDSITRLVVGKTGYVYVLGGKGDQRGKYIVSSGGQRDGESIWEAKDADGRLFVQSIINKGLKTSNGSMTNEFYPWINPGEPAPRAKFASITYFEPWDWVIGAGTYQEDFAGVLTRIDGAIQRLVYGAGIVAMVVGLFGLVVSYFVSAGIVRPVNRVIEDLDAGSDQVTSAVNQLAMASQALADGASQQAASLGGNKRFAGGDVEHDDPQCRECGEGQ
jgi:methyl-accepting chemotaxis protein